MRSIACSVVAGLALGALSPATRSPQSEPATTSTKAAAVAEAVDGVQFESYVKSPKAEASVTLEGIRAVVKEELAKVTVTLKSGAQVQAPVNQSVQLNPGERIVAINGVPVQSSGSGSTGGGSSGGTTAYQSSVAQVTYSTPAYSVQTYSTPAATQAVVYSSSPQTVTRTVTPVTGPRGRVWGYQSRTCYTDPVTGQRVCR